VAITVHLEQGSKLLAMLLDIVKVPKSHTGLNLALVFVKVLEDFGIEDKVRAVYLVNDNRDSHFQDLGCDC
jgi:hypothetical protein